MTTRSRPQPGQAHSADGRGGTHDARVKRSAWLLAAFAILFYVGFIVLSLVRGAK